MQLLAQGVPSCWAPEAARRHWGKTRPVPLLLLLQASTTGHHSNTQYSDSVSTSSDPLCLLYALCMYFVCILNFLETGVTGLPTSDSSHFYSAGSGWVRANFLYSSLYSAVLDLRLKQSWQHTSILVVAERSSHSVKAFSASRSAPSVGGLGMGKRLRGDSQDSWPKLVRRVVHTI